VAAGALALALGAVALSARKGGTIHRRSGVLFVYAMLVMGLSAAILGNVGGGLLSAYFVATALTTVRPISAWTRGVNLAALTVAVALALGSLARGWQAYNSPGGWLNGVPFVMHFFIAAVLTLAATGDVRIMRSGAPRGGPRLARHLWRMCFALFIAAGSFFSVRERVEKVLPDAFASAPMRALPMLLLFGAMFFFWRRVRVRQGSSSRWIASGSVAPPADVVRRSVQSSQHPPPGNCQHVRRQPVQHAARVQQ
jgi:uncharacterized membrane protein